MGDRVAAFTAGGDSPRWLAPAALTAEVPPVVGLEAAAAAPLMLSTAVLLLEDVVHLRPGESVLMHSASSGVGSAVPQVTAALHSGSGSERLAVTPGFLMPWPWAGITPCRTTRRPARRSARSCPGGADAIPDPGGTQNLDLGLAVAAPGARIVLFGSPGGGAPADCRQWDA